MQEVNKQEASGMVGHFVLSSVGGTDGTDGTDGTLSKGAIQLFSKYLRVYVYEIYVDKQSTHFSRRGRYRGWT